MHISSLRSYKLPRATWKNGYKIWHSRKKGALSRDYCFATISKRSLQKIGFVMSEEISLSIEETNQLRAKLGMKPLVIDAGKCPDSRKIDTSSIPILDDKARKLEKERESNKRLFDDLTSGGGILDSFSSNESEPDSEDKFESHEGKKAKAGDLDVRDSGNSDSSSSSLSGDSDA